MKGHARRLAVLAFLVAAGCAGTGDSPVSGGTFADDERVSTVADTDDAVDWIDECLPELARVASLIEASEFDAAREALTTWAAPGLEVLCADLSAERQHAVAERLDALTVTLSELSVQRMVRRYRCDLLEQELPAEHPLVLAMKQSLAVTLHALGDTADAHLLFRGVHTVLERDLAPEDPELLRAKAHLGMSYRRLGDLENAHVLYQYVHRVREKNLHAEHLELLAAKHDLAVTVKARGDLRRALELQEYVHEVHERILPEHHPALLIAKSNLAGTRRDVGDIDGALELMEHVHNAWSQTLPSDHPNLLSASLNLARMYDACGRFAEALQVVERVHGVQQVSLQASDINLLKTKALLAELMRKGGDFEGAYSLFEQVHDAFDALLPPEHPELLDAKRGLGAVCRQLGHYERAHAFFEYVHDVYERNLHLEHPELLGAKLNLALTSEDLGDIARALLLEEHVHRVWGKTLTASDPRMLALQNNLANTRRAAGDLLGAIEIHKHVHQELEACLSAQHPDLLAAKASLAAALFRFGDLGWATELQEYVLKARQAYLPHEHPEVLSIEQELGASLLAIGYTARAHELLFHVYEVRLKSLPPDHPDLLIAAGNLACARREMGDIFGSLELEDSVLQARAKLLLMRELELIWAKQNIGVTRSRVGDHLGAHEMFEHVHRELERVLAEGHPDLLRAGHNLASSRLRSGDLAGAEILCGEVHGMRARLLPASHPDLLETKALLASVRRARGDLIGAYDLSVYVLDERRRFLPEEHVDVVSAKFACALSLRAMGRNAEALELVLDVTQTLESLLPPHHQDLREATQSLAGLYADCGNIDAWRGAAVALLQIQNMLATSLSVHSPRLSRSITITELERLSWLASWSEALVLEGRPSLDDKVVEVLESFRSLSGESSMAARAMAQHPELATTRDELERVGRKIARVRSERVMGALDVDTWRSQMHELAESRDGLHRELRKGLSKVGSQVNGLTVASIADSLPDRTVYVGFWRFDHWRPQIPGGQRFEASRSFLAFVILPDGQMRSIQLGAAKSIDEAVDRWRMATESARPTRSPDFEVASEGMTDVAQAGNVLRALVLDPILAAVPGAKTLHLVPDDALFLVPFDALPLGEGVVGDQLTIRIGTNARQFDMRFERPTGAPSLLAIGGVDYAGTGVRPDDMSVVTTTAPLDRTTRSVVGASFAELPGAAAETAAVAELFRSARAIEPQLLTGDGATKAALADAIGNARYVHIATHGWFAPESTAVSMLDQVGEHVDDALLLSIDRAQEMIVGFLPETLCGLALTGANNGPDGILTAEELRTLDFTKCELAVLSACETNVGIHRAGQGIQSLQSSLHAAGVRTAITSLWKVDDEATRKLFESFYTKLWVEKLGPADALWQAKCELRAAGHPVREWAAWVLTGDPD